MMQFQLEPQEQFLLGYVSGLVSPPAWERVLGELQDAIAQSAQDRLLLDLTGLLGWLGTPERRAVGASMATRFARMNKVALVIQAPKITGVVQDEARSHGLDLRLFSDRDEAVRWLAG